MSFIPSGKSLTVGGRTFSEAEINDTGFKILTGYAAAAATRTGLFESFTQTSYGPSGVAFRMLAVQFTSNTSGTGSVNLFYADNQLLASVTTALTNGVYAMVTSTFEMQGISATAGSRRVLGFPCDHVVPDGKFPGIEENGTDDTSVIVVGIEE